MTKTLAYVLLEEYNQFLSGAKHPNLYQSYCKQHIHCFPTTTQVFYFIYGIRVV